MSTDTARADLEFVRAAIATGVLIRGDLAWSVTAVCDELDRISTKLENAMSDANKLEIGWAILELMGHRKLSGLVRPVELGGSVLLRIDVPTKETTSENGPWSATQFYSPNAVYCITPCTMETAIQAATIGAVAPVSRWELPAPKPDIVNHHMSNGDVVAKMLVDAEDDDRPF